jgi:thiol-disulfide isomerase/thioredoxin
MQETFNNLMNNNKLLIGFGILWLFLTLVIAYFSYTSFIKPIISKHKLNKEFINKDENSEDITVMYFYTEWCPYCKKAKPEWSKFQSYVNNKNETIDYTIKLTSINCDENKKMADKYQINGYPTVKLIYKNKVYDFDAKVTKDTLIKFLDSIK